MATTPSKSEQARNLTGPQTGESLEPLRTAILIAKHNGGRVYWPKSVYPTLTAAYEAMKAAGIDGGLDFTQYRAAGPFENLVELIAAKAPVTGPTAAEIAEATEKLSAELEANGPAIAAILDAPLPGEETPAEPKAEAKPAADPAELLKLVEAVAKATRLQGVKVEARQGGKRHVILLELNGKPVVLAYVDPLLRGKGYRVEVANYGGYTKATVADAAAAAELVKGSERRKPRAKKAAEKATATTAPAAPAASEAPAAS